ncbi:hypothetical protein C8F01DRAFT_988287 [Mycena amicta]|nr:hypothetical protein C8F01DRAFT_988287 [Mycena amicta]
MSPRAEIGRFSVHDLTDELFQQAFSRGPLVVTGIDLCWPPQQFIDIYGRHKCVLVDSETGRTEESDIHKFMGRLERPGKKKKFAILKAWDFPVDDLLSDACPRLCDEFFAATPPAAQRYLLPNAFCNLAAHLFKDNSVVPDLGPKMYAAEANVLHASKASTPLHLDMAPAMNICVYASDKSKEEGAAWDIFAAADTDKIRSFLRESVADETDWVQARTKYITDLMRKKLWDEYGVLSYRVYQKAGEAVFIPAGCAHQVRNLGDCIKVAIDFVPPWQLAECARVSEEIRGVPGREDLLQLRYMCWEALRSCLKYEASTSA